jgi:hypothetical protein
MTEETAAPNGTRERPYQYVGSCDGVCPVFGTRCSPCPQLSTEDNRTPIHEGDLLYNYYDGWWGRVRDIREYDGWFTLVEEGGTGRRASLNGARCSTKETR